MRARRYFGLRWTPRRGVYPVAGITWHPHGTSAGMLVLALVAVLWVLFGCAARAEDRPPSVLHAPSPPRYITPSDLSPGTFRPAQESPNIQLLLDRKCQLATSICHISGTQADCLIQASDCDTAARYRQHK
jgi:hypothetical protein